MALMETLQDRFNQGSFSSLWTITGPGTPANNVLLLNGEVEITTDAVSGDYFELQSVNSYDLTSSYAFVQVVSVGSQATNFDYIPLVLLIDSNNEVWWDIGGNTIAAFKKVASTQTQILSVSYVANTHRWLRIRESGGTTFWDYSPDPVNQGWTNFTSQSNPIAVTSLKAGIETGQFGAASASTTKTANFNSLINQTSYRPFTVPNKTVGPMALRRKFRYPYVGRRESPYTFAQGFNPTLSFTGSLSKQANKGLLGSLGFAGTISRAVNKPVAATLSFTGALNRAVNKSLNGSLSLSGALASTRAITKNLTASLSFSGALVKHVNKGLSASLSPGGSLVKLVNKPLSGALNLSGNLAKTINKPLAGTLIFVGNLTKVANKTLSATLDFGGSLIQAIAKGFSATLSFGGSLNKQVNKNFTASLNFTGLLHTTFARVKTYLLNIIRPQIINLTVQQVATSLSVQQRANTLTIEHPTSALNVRSLSTTNAINSPAVISITVIQSATNIIVQL